MIIDNTAGLQYLLNDDIYLLKQDMDNLDAVVSEPVMPTIEEPAAEAPKLIVSTPEPVVVTAQATVAEAPALFFDHLGSNAKQFLILCCYPELQQMDDKHLEALKSALNRKELALDDVAILNIANHTHATIAQLSQYFKPARLLLLGAPCLLSGWDKLALNQLNNLGGIKALYTHSFTEMMGDRDKTKAFWEQMKVL
jgi:hypothetical protein